MDDISKWEHLEAKAKTTSTAERGFGSSLCSRCGSAVMWRREGKMDVTIYCQVIEGPVPSDIKECSAYNDPTAMSLYDMQKIAVPVDGRHGVHDKSYL